MKLKSNAKSRKKIVINDLKGLLGNGFKAALAVALAPFSPVTTVTYGLDSLIGFWKAIGVKQDIVGQATIVVFESYFITLGKSLTSYVTSKEVKAEIEKKISNELAMNISVFAEEYNLFGLAIFPLNQSPLFNDLQKLTHELLIACDFAVETVVNILNKIQSEYTLNLGHYLWQTRTTNKAFCTWFYKNIPAENRDTRLGRSVINYKERTKKEVLEKLPIARGTDYENCFNLSNIYVEPHAIIEGPEAENSTEPIIDLVLKLIDSSQPIMTHGSPGHGKTSFAKVLCKKITDIRRDILPIFVVFNAIPANTHFGHFLKSQFGEWLNLDFLKRNRTLFVIDGIDEAQAVEGRSAFGQIFDSITYLINDVNKSASEILSTVIYTGRTNFIDSYRTCFPQETKYVELLDLQPEQQKIWLTNFAKLAKLTVAERPTIKKLDALGLSDFTGQPVLLTIVSMMFIETEGKNQLTSSQERQIDKADIYDRLIAWTYERRWAQPKFNHLAYYIPSLTDYYKILGTIALAIHSRGGRSIKETNLVRLLKNKPHLIENIRELSVQKLLQMTKLSFYFRSVEGFAYEFVHKSLEDYLVATLIENTADDIKRFSSQYVKSAILPIFYELFANRSIEANHIDFLEILFQRRNLQYKVDLFEMLKLVWELICEDKHICFEEYLLENVSRHNAAVNCSLSIFGLITCLNFVIQDNLPDDNKKLWKIQSGESSGDVFSSFIDFIDSSGDRSFASSGVKLRYVDLCNLNLSRKFLDSLDMSHSALKNVDFRHSSLEGAAFRNADLENADFRGANLRRADLRGANTVGTLVAGVCLDSVIADWDLSGIEDDRMRLRSKSRSRKRNVRAILIDDDGDMVELLARIIEQNIDCECDMFTSPRVALEAIRRKRYDVVITDMKMPKVDGIVLLKEVKALFPDVPVIIMTAYATIESAVEATRLGAFEYVTKPFGKEGILLPIKRAIDHYNMIRKL